VPGDLVYSEVDVAEMRERWENAAKEATFTTQLAQLTGAVQAMPEQMRVIARNVALEVVLEQRNQRGATRWVRWPIVAGLVLTGLGVLIDSTVLVIKLH
jgi:hypothetical protein